MRHSVTFLLLLAACFGAQVGCTPEPEYKGRRLGLWVRDLEAKTPDDRQRACEAIASLGPAAAPAIAPLTERLGDENARVREAAIEALGAVGEASVPALEQIVANASVELRAHAAEALVGINPSHAAAQAELVRAASDVTNPTVAGRGRAGLVKLGAAALPLVLPTLTNPDVEVRVQAIRILGALGDSGRGATTQLAAVSKSDPVPQARKEALLALANLGPWETVEPIVRAATADADDGVASYAGFMINERLPADKRPRVQDPEN